MSDRVVTIEKLDPVRLRQEKLPFTLHMNYVLQQVRHPLALAIWVYLSSLPDDWKVHRTQLMEHFQVGRDKLGDALKYLNENKLIEYVQEKIEAGKFGISHIFVKSGYEFEVIHRNQSALLKNRTTVSPLSGETAPTNKINNTNKIKDKNKSFCSSNNLKAENQKKHSWAEKPKSPTADVTKQSTSYNPENHKPSKPLSESEGYKKFRESSPYLRRKYARTESSNTNETNELPTGTEVQPEVAATGHTSVQSVEPHVGGVEDIASPLRVQNRLMETRRACVYLETLGVASATG